MDIGSMARRVASGPARVELEAFEGGGFSPEDVVAGLSSEMRPVWAALTDFGWLYVDRDPSSLTPDSPISGAQFGEGTWGELMENSYVVGLQDFAEYASADDFASEEEVLLTVCDHEEEGREEMAEALRAGGLVKAAEALEALDFG